MICGIFGELSAAVLSMMMMNKSVDCVAGCMKIDSSDESFYGEAAQIFGISIGCAIFDDECFANGTTTVNVFGFWIVNDFANCCRVVDRLMVSSAIQTIWLVCCSAVAIFPDFVSLCRHTTHPVMKFHCASLMVGSSDS